MLRINFAFGLSIGFIFIIGVFGASIGNFPTYENADSTRILPSQTFNYYNQFNSVSSYPIFLSPQPLESTSLSQSVSVPASATNIQLFPNTDVSSIIQPGIFSNGFISSFQPQVFSKDSAIVSSASTTQNTVSASASSGKTNVVSANTYSVVAPDVEALAQSISQALSSIPAVKNFLTVSIPVSEISNIFYSQTTKVLANYGHSDPHRLASFISQPVKLFDVFTFPLLFNAIGKSVAEFLFREGVEITPNVSQLYSSYIENSIDSYNVSNPASLIEAIWNGSVNFIIGLGFNFIEKTDYLGQIFVDEFTALKN